MIILIVTHGREGNVKTAQQIPQSWRSQTYIVHGPGEKHTDLLEAGFQLLKTPRGVADSIAEKRQWLCNWSQDRYVYMMDDDLTFYARDYDNLMPKGYPRLRRSSMSEMNRLLRQTRKDLFTYPLVGVGRRFMNFSRPPIRYNTYVESNYSIDLEVLKRHRIRFDDADFGQDQHVALSLVEAGYTIIFRSDWAVGHPQMGANPGGCSLTRTVERVINSDRILHELHPATVNIIEEPGYRNHAGLLTNQRYRIDWKLAVKMGKKE